MLSRKLVFLTIFLLLGGSICLAGGTRDLPEGLPEGADEQWLTAVQENIQSVAGTESKEFEPDFSGWNTVGDRELAEFGARVAPAGDVNGDGYSDVIVGSPDFMLEEYVYPGRVWVFLGGPDGLATTPAWSATGEDDGDEFGGAIACAGDVNDDGYDDIIVGAPGELGGYVYVYYGSSSGPVTATRWHDNRGYSISRYAVSVSTAGDVNGDGFADILVGDPWENAYDGAVWLYYGSASGLDRDDHLTYYGHTEAYLGVSVSSAGDIDADGLMDWVAGADRDEYNSPWDHPGAVLIVYGNGTSEYISGDTNFHGLGWMVSLAGDVDGDGYADVLVSSERSFPAMESIDAETRLYLGSASGLSSTPAWTVTNGEESGTDFDSGAGFQIATAGDVNGDGYADVLLGCEFQDVGTEIDSGETRLYMGGPDGLPVDPVWSRTYKQSDALLGSVSTAGDVNGDGYSDILIGGRGIDGTFTDGGEAFCYLGGGEGLSEEHSWIYESNRSASLLGWSVAPAGDVNGDGYGDVLVGASLGTDGELNEGIVYLFLGSASGVETFPEWRAQGNQAQAQFGQSVSSAGDVNGDGYADILIGAPHMDDTAALEGAVFLFLGQRYSMSDGTPENADWSYYSGQYQAWLGTSVACAGDVNGDGLSDIVVGAPRYDAGTTDEGGVFVFHGSKTGLASTADWFHDTAKADCRYGQSVASAGDINGDGYSDIIVGAPEYDHPGNEIGLVFVYIGSETGLLNGAPWWHAEGDETEGHFGCSVASAGDVNGDGYSDVIIGARDQDSSVADSGECFAWYGAATAPATGTPANADWHIAFPAEVGLGHAVSSAGDVNNDGYSDVIVGAPDGDSAESNAGWVMIFCGSESGLSTANDTWILGDNVNGHFGMAVASAGDVNGDGVSDVIVGAPWYDNGHADEGRVYVFDGGGGEGLLRLPCQKRAFGNTPLCPLTGSDSMTAFDLEFEARSAAGRERVRMDYEIREAGEDFSGANLLQLIWTDTGAPYYNQGSSIEIDQAVTGLTAGTQYKWRLRSVSRNPYFPRSPWYSLAWNGQGEADMRTAAEGTAVEDGPVMPSMTSVTCYPNPFNPRTTIRFSLPMDGPVSLKVFDVAGRLVSELVNRDMAAGEHKVVWTGRHGSGAEAASGVYMYRLKTARRVLSGQMILVR